jgi:hypothetical protein
VRGLTPCPRLLPPVKTVVSFRQDAVTLPCSGGGVSRFRGRDVTLLAASAHLQWNPRWPPGNEQNTCDGVLGHSVCRSPCWWAEVCRAQEVCCAIRDHLRGRRMGESSRPALGDRRLIFVVSGLPGNQAASERFSKFHSAVWVARLEELRSSEQQYGV